MANYDAMSKQLNGPGKYFKAEPGENRIRVVTVPLMTWKAFDKVAQTAKVYLTEDEAMKDENAKPRCQMYVFNRDCGNRLQLAEFGPQVMKKFFKMAKKSITQFVDIPPYDMIITKSGEGFDTEYELDDVREHSKITPEEQKLIDAAKPIIEVLLEDPQVVDKDAYRGIKPLTESAMVPPSTKEEQVIRIEDIPFP